MSGMYMIKIDVYWQKFNELLSRKDTIIREIRAFNQKKNKDFNLLKSMEGEFFNKSSQEKLVK